MKKVLTTALAALTFGGAVVATAAPAQAQRYDRHYGGRYYDHHRHRDRGGDALAAGVVGLALGAAIASSSNNNRSYYSNGYYGSGYGYYDDGPRYRYRHRSTVCETSRWVWDPYIGRRVLVRERYRC